MSAPSLSLVSRDAAIAVGVAPIDCAPVVLDLGETSDWASALQPVLIPSARRILCFFGIVAAFSANLRAVNWRTIGFGIALQLTLAFGF